MAGVAAAIPFALGPALANNGVIDCSASEGVKIHTAATSPLVEDPLFDCEANNLSHLLGKIGIRSHANGWGASIFAIPMDPAPSLGDACSFLDQHGAVTLAQVRAHALTYVATNARAAQDSVQLGIAVVRSVSVAGFNRLNIRRDECTIGGHVAGVVLLNALIGVSHVDTNATTSFIRSELCSLELCLPTIGHDVENLNKHVRHLMERLSSRGETAYDLLSFLFKACAVVPDAKFRDHIEMEKSEHKEGRVTQDGQPFTSECLMLLGDNECKGMKQNKTWIVPSAADEKIVALQAEVTKLKQDISSKPPPLKPPPKDTKKGRADEPAWMTKEPNTGGPTVIANKGKECWWCPKHHSWGRHKPQDCEGKEIQQSTAKPEGARESKLANAMSALAENEFDEDS
jgi:hypothetical protein